MEALLQKSQSLLAYSTFIFGLIFLISCSKDDPEEEHDHEEFSHIEFRIKTGTTEQKLTWVAEEEHEHEEEHDDDDHESHGEFEGVDTIKLKNGTKSEVTIKIWNRHDGENEDITEEIKEEVDVHQFFYEFSPEIVKVESSQSDLKDKDGIELKLFTDWTPSSIGSGKVEITLIHEPTNKTGTREQAGGDADFEIIIDFIVEEQ